MSLSMNHAKRLSVEELMGYIDVVSGKAALEIQAESDKAMWDDWKHSGNKIKENEGFSVHANPITKTITFKHSYNVKIGSFTEDEHARFLASHVADILKTL